MSQVQSGSLFPYSVLTHEVNAGQNSAIHAAFVSAGFTHGEVHYPCGLDTNSKNSDSMRAEVHHPEGLSGDLLCVPEMSVVFNNQAR